MRFPLLLCTLSLALVPLVFAENRGVINDPDGFTNVRAKQSADSAVVAKVKLGETFEFQGKEGADWWKVTLASGQTGYMHSSRIRFYVTPKDLADTGPGDEVNQWGKREGFDYYPLARAAVKGDRAAMRRYFALEGDGAAAETHLAVLNTVMHLLGDEKLAKFLGEQPAADREKFRERLLYGFTLYPFETVPYMKRNFPKTVKVLWRE